MKRHKNDNHDYTKAMEDSHDHESSMFQDNY